MFTQSSSRVGQFLAPRVVTRPSTVPLRDRRHPAQHCTSEGATCGGIGRFHRRSPSDRYRSSMPVRGTAPVSFTRQNTSASTVWARTETPTSGPGGPGERQRSEYYRVLHLGLRVLHLGQHRVGADRDVHQRSRRPWRGAAEVSITPRPAPCGRGPRRPPAAPAVLEGSRQRSVLPRHTVTVYEPPRDIQVRCTNRLSTGRPVLLQQLKAQSEPCSVPFPFRILPCAISRSSSGPVSRSRIPVRYPGVECRGPFIPSPCASRVPSSCPGPHIPVLVFRSGPVLSLCHISRSRASSPGSVSQSRVSVPCPGAASTHV